MRGGEHGTQSLVENEVEILGRILTEKNPGITAAEDAERRKCSHGNVHKCPIFEEMEDDGGVWPVVPGS